MPTPNTLRFFAAVLGSQLVFTGCEGVLSPTEDPGGTRPADSPDVAVRCEDGTGSTPAALRERFVRDVYPWLVDSESGCMTCHGPNSLQKFALSLDAAEAFDELYATSFFGKGPDSLHARIDADQMPLGAPPWPDEAKAALRDLNCDVISTRTEDVVSLEEPCGLPATRIWELTPAQLRRSVDAILPGGRPDGDQLGRTIDTASRVFSNEARFDSMSDEHVDDVFQWSIDVGTLGVDALIERFDCLAEPTWNASCLSDMVTAVSSQAFRRPLTETESTDLVAFVEEERTQSGESQVALSLFLERVFLSPHFLFRSELGSPGGEPEVELTAFEIASAISYLLTDAPPDAELWSAAEAGELQSDSQIGEHVSRLLGDIEDVQGLQQFLSEWLHTDELPSAQKDPSLFPDFDESLAADLEQESRRFFAYVLSEDDGRLQTLLSADYSILNNRLAAWYGIEPGEGEGFRRVSLQGQPRAGVLTQAGFLAATAGASLTDPVHRGLVVNAEALCNPVPPPPEDLDVEGLSEAGPAETAREQLAIHVANPACAGCHTLIDPPGLALESYDAAGRYRTNYVEGGPEIDASGSFWTQDGELRFDSWVEFVEQLSGDSQVRDCFARQMYRYGLGINDTGSDRCAVDSLAGAFAESDGNIVRLITELVVSDAFRRRRVE